MTETTAESRTPKWVWPTLAGGALSFSIAIAGWVNTEYRSFKADSLASDKKKTADISAIRLELSERDKEAGDSRDAKIEKLGRDLGGKMERVLEKLDEFERWAAERISGIDSRVVAIENSRVRPDDLHRVEREIQTEVTRINGELFGIANMIAEIRGVLAEKADKKDVPPPDVRRRLDQLETWYEKLTEKIDAILTNVRASGVFPADGGLHGLAGAQLNHRADRGHHQEEGTGGEPDARPFPTGSEADPGADPRVRSGEAG